jgi:hypothetical protein
MRRGWLIVAGAGGLAACAGSGPHDAGVSDASADADVEIRPDAADDAQDSATGGDAHDAADGSEDEGPGDAEPGDADDAGLDVERQPASPLPALAAGAAPPSVEFPARRAAPDPGAFAFVAREGLFAGHAWRSPALDYLGYGAGGGLMDVDGDLDLDLFVGCADCTVHPACLYENTSVPGAIRFESDPMRCFDLGADDVSATAVDVDRDGRHELVLTALDGAWFVSEWPSLEVVPLALGTTAGQPPCAAATGAPIDLDLDGDLDLLIPCQRHVHDRGRAWLEVPARPFVWDGEAFVDGGEDLDALRTPWNTLAYGLGDIDGDGLIDLIPAVDTLSNPERRNTTIAAGEALLRCGPDEPCTFRTLPLAPGLDAWGSFMGVSALDVDGTPSWYLTDWGPNRLVRFDDGALVDSAPSLRAALSGQGRDYLFAWGVVADDLDGNGLDDLLVAQGPPPELQGQERWHYDAVLLQGGDGAFLALSGHVGLRDHAERVDGMRAGSRGFLRADLDGDGQVEYLRFPYEGRVEVLTLATREPRPHCTVIPRDRAGAGVPVFGYGLAFGPTADGPWRVRDAWGQMRLSPSPWPVLAGDSGWLRWPDGRVAEWRCAEGRRALVDVP